MSSPSTDVRKVLEAALRANSRQLGKVFEIDPELNMKAAEVVERGGAANSGAVGNIRCAIRAIIQGEIPTSPTVSRQCVGAVNGLLRDNPDFPAEVKNYLFAVRQGLEDRALSEVYREVEAVDRREASDDLVRTVEQRGGVYVYSLPHYLNFPCKVDPERYWYKVGFTTGDSQSRVISSHRKTGLPEDPVVRRTYFSSSLQPRDMEARIHKLLIASGLQTDAETGGEEWFATTEEQLDAIADALGFEIVGPTESSAEEDE
jgi:hypothetical protein